MTRQDSITQDKTRQHNTIQEKTKTDTIIQTKSRKKGKSRRDKTIQHKKIAIQCKNI